MFDNLVTYHIHKRHPLPANDALAYQYVLAGNGVFVRAETRFFTALLPVTACTVRGLPPLRPQFQRLVPRIPARLLDAVLADARRARRLDHGLSEVLYQFHHQGRAVEVKKPSQQTTPTSVATSVTTAVADADRIICDLHSHGNMRAFFSQTDNADEQGARLYAVIGRVDSGPEMRLRVGVYGYWLALPLTAVFTNNGPSKIYTRRKKMTNNGHNNGRAANDDYTGFTYELEEPIAVKGFSVTYDRKFNTGNFESLNPAITIWVKSIVPEGEAFDLHHAKERVRRMARENVRAQLLRLQGNPEVVFLGLQPPLSGPTVFTGAGSPDPIFVRTVSVSLTYKVNLGDYNSITLGYTDWHDVRYVAHSPGELHMALDRMWQSLWANVEDEISRAQGKGGSGGFFGLPAITVEDLTGSSKESANGHGFVVPAMPAASARPVNGRHI